jgi:hypothetical protein
MLYCYHSQINKAIQELDLPITIISNNNSNKEMEDIILTKCNPDMHLT